MNDPHIDLDEIDSGEAGPRMGATTPLGGNGPFEAGSYDMGSVFANMTRQFQRWSNDFSLLPTDTARHLRASQREFLMAWRSLIDHSLERLERQDMRDTLREDTNLGGETIGRGAEKIQVEEIED